MACSSDSTAINNNIDGKFVDKDINTEICANNNKIGSNNNIKYETDPHSKIPTNTEVNWRVQRSASNTAIDHETETTTNIEMGCHSTDPRPPSYDTVVHMNDEKELSKTLLTLWDFGDPEVVLGQQTPFQLFSKEVQEIQVTGFLCGVSCNIFCSGKAGE